MSFFICHYDEYYSNSYVFKLSTTLLGVILSNITSQCHFAQRHSLKCHFDIFHYGECHNVSGIMMIVILLSFFLLNVNLHDIVVMNVILNGVVLLNVTLACVILLNVVMPGW